ncbi:PREDICTED: uncharacterized protein LOC105965821 [Erythranthe guttata]|uniref:uncharacterized protein LOC105965821 n=1 Tax=Erythranthe guttata TaxID=4155 RepID=UPI00064E09E8|nr:PREDICTED: uncharacterized protein LOC105965821 [Erythranthe guttata]|eukprot:XP_012845827.1 PREDICTED: uncharacterized protein LOC105965821 [Erythranthe guttata]
MNSIGQLPHVPSIRPIDASREEHLSMRDALESSRPDLPIFTTSRGFLDNGKMVTDLPPATGGMSRPIYQVKIYFLSYFVYLDSSVFVQLCFGDFFLILRSCITASSTVSAGSLADLSNLANTSIYGFEDYHGVDIGVVRGVRLWFSALAGEIPVEIKINDTDTKLGFTIRRTEEGFIYISSVVEADNPSERSGLSSLYKQASLASRLLVVSRISNRKVLP